MYADYPHKIIATIEARMTSSRLPGKVLLSIEGKPTLQWIIERLQQSKYIDDVVVATTINSADDPLIALAERCGAKHFRGSEEDVLGRVLRAAQSVGGDIIVEITGDNPLLDIGLIDQGIEMFYEKKVDYLGNISTNSFPLGLAVQVFPTAVLAQVEKATSDPIDRSHVSCYMYNNPDKYSLYLWKGEGDFYWPELRLTIDEQADYELMQEIYKRLLPKNKYFTSRDVIQLVKNEPKLLLINKHVRQKNLEEG